MFRKRTEIKDEDRVIKNRERSQKKTFDRAVNLLTYKPRSTREMRERLLEKVWTDQEIVEEVIEKLKKYNYLNDVQFARDFAASRIRQKPIGKRRLRIDLIKRKLDKETIDSALAEVFEENPEYEIINRAIAKRLRIKGIPREQPEKKKFFDHLLRLGFDYDVIRDKMREIDSGEFESEEQ